MLDFLKGVEPAQHVFAASSQVGSVRPPTWKWDSVSPLPLSEGTCRGKGLEISRGVEPAEHVFAAGLGALALAEESVNTMKVDPYLSLAIF